MLEIIAETVDSAIAIEKCGAGRIELVSGLTEGGVTPSLAMIKQVTETVNIPVNVMVRPHARSFCYSESDMSVILSDIEYIKQTKANGIVFGALDENNEICIENLERVIEAADGLDIVFHKAFDAGSDLIKNIEILSAYPQIKTVLTSGGTTPITENYEILNQIIDKSKHIEILLGGGVSFANIKDLMQNINTNSYHLGTAVRFDNSCLKEVSDEKLTELVGIVNNK